METLQTVVHVFDGNKSNSYCTDECEAYHSPRRDRKTGASPQPSATELRWSGRKRRGNEVACTFQKSPRNVCPVCGEEPH